MQDEPPPDEIIAAVARFLREVAAPATSGHLSFNLRVCANALEMSRRQASLDPPAAAAETERLRALLAMDGDLATLNAELARRLAAGKIDLTTPGLAEHLWATTLAKLAVDQPTYWGYRAAVEERGETPSTPSGSPSPSGGGEDRRSLPPLGEVPAKPGRGASRPQD
ncbi:MAG TPA: DUF6285 domain-containing protein [Caulobacteraceae bacterium]|nr:DUF6285 domain-containing protein [Caulobacteraceae bacterium]